MSCCLEILSGPFAPLPIWISGRRLHIQGNIKEGIWDYAQAAREAEEGEKREILLALETIGKIHKSTQNWLKKKTMVEKIINNF
ncbi:hypothetical protein SAMN02745975_00832 [Geosporobacter subterraneus DSM 17957]|uniref:Uncharacterized protein n=1 Tax=Geosporobacter subterraneus DSM 17957 TaxID=1121919 RepID=A0A1M6EUI6_9FIRM|nr:hypothetical protein SAMN02745975_00832 [Geosporobacter subterraneus DSM 17957]